VNYHPLTWTLNQNPPHPTRTIFFGRHSCKSPAEYRILLLIFVDCRYVIQFASVQILLTRQLQSVGTTNYQQANKLSEIAPYRRRKGSHHHAQPFVLLIS
jgi:hypothetical protein